ncbi:DUF2637 domain-containing protein [Streptomonospora litoralis]|uniref:DUF2637 domain-containing protein n=1 Tax=Streptomonospora litoralis TaxID=2498135 RepID=A0A4P6QBE3_9ACTN|nr:DUF2637 domain-containing protein [Streptomonospora litoralis]QBI56747.1 hypothetical protein EKD16_25030 [Streptomonospora litoralis]
MTAPPDIPDRLVRAVVDELAGMPWYAWLTTGLLLSALAVLAAWWVVRTVRRVGRALLAAIREAAHGDQAARRRIRQVLNGMSLTTALSVSLVVAQGFGALGIARVLHEHAEVPEPFNWLGFAVFQALAVILMAIINERAEQGVPARGVTLGFWALIAAEALFNTTHSDNLVGRAVFAVMTLVAAFGYHLRMGQKRRGREEELRRAEGRWANRRIALIRWLHPVERIAVAVELARDEELGADAATRTVRERSAERRRLRLRRRAARALWRRRRVQLGGRLARLRHPASERRAQAALDAAGIADDTAELAGVMRSVQVLALADRIAETDYTDPSGARGLVASLITEEALQRRLELPPPTPAAPPAAASDTATASTPTPEPWTETDPEWERLIDSEEGGGALIPLTGPDRSSAPVSVAQVRAARAADEPARTLPPHERYDTARRMWSDDHSVTGAELAWATGAGESTARRWRSAFATEHNRSGLPPGWRVEPGDRT